MKVSVKPAAAHKTHKPKHSAPTEKPLTAAHQAKIMSIYNALQASGQLENKRAGGLPLGLRFKSLDVTPQMHSASFGHSSTILVPEGALSPDVKADPNTATQFYVQCGASTNRPGGIYGPFDIK
jgi:hypothetical protein